MIDVFGVERFDIVKSFLPGGLAKPISQMTGAERTAVRTLKGVRKPVKSEKDIKLYSQMNASLSQGKKQLASFHSDPKWHSPGKNLLTNMSHKDVKRLQKQGAFPKKAKKPTYVNEYAGMSNSGSTHHLGSKRDPVAVNVSRPLTHLRSGMENKVNRHVVGHEFVHASPTKRSLGRMQQITGNQKKLMREEARSDVGSAKKGAAGKVKQNRVSGYEERAAIAQTAKKATKKGDVARNIQGALPPLFDSKIMGDSYKKVNFADYSSMRAKLGSKVTNTKNKELKTLKSIYKS